MKTNNEQIYNVLLEMKEEIGEMRADLRTVKEQTIKTNGRVTKLEAFKENLQGKVAIVSAIIGAASGLVISWIKRETGL